MKNYIFIGLKRSTFILLKLSSTILLLFFFFFTVKLTAQSDPVYSPRVEGTIKRVVGNLIDPDEESRVVLGTLSERMAYYNIPAVSIAVIKNYKVHWARAYGFADKESEVKATTNTLFQAASISKSVNALGVLKWAEANNIDLESDIDDHLKSWEFECRKRARGKKFTLANLLSHTGGLSVHGFNGYESGQSIPTVVQILNGKGPANSDRVKSLTRPGVKFMYSGGGTTISQLILTDNTGHAYERYMQDKILNPLGMNESSFAQPPTGTGSYATAYYSQGNSVNGKFHIYPEMAAAGLWTNPLDLSKFVIEIQNSLIGKSNKILTSGMTQLMLSPYLVNGHSGLGVYLEEIDGKVYFSHDGSNKGFRSIYIGSTKGGNGIVLMINSENFDISKEIIATVFDVYGW